MRARTVALSVAALLAGALSLASAEDPPPAAPAVDTAPDDAAVEAALKKAVARVEPSIVEIETLGSLPEKIEAPKEGEEPKGSAEGVLAKAGFKQAQGPSSGIAVAKDLVVTSTFCLEDRPRHIFVTRADGRSFVAEPLGRDESRKIILLKVEGAELTPAVAAPRESWKVGRFAIALGRGLGTSEPSVSLGIVSATQRIGGKAIQTSASVSPACYGGPLATIEGEVLGVLVPLTAFGGQAGVELYDSGIGFAIPLTDVLELRPRLERGDVLKPAFLGIGIDQGRTEDGVLVESVQPGSAAQKAKLRPKDIIIEVDGKPIQAFFQLHQELGRRSAGETIRLGLLRKGKKREVEITLGEPPPPEAGKPPFQLPGMPGPGGPQPKKPDQPDGGDDDDEKH
jgi:serine protease Do